MGGVMKELWAQLGVRHLHTSVYHPQCNGLVERFNKTLKGMLRRFAIDDPYEWPKYVEPVLFAVREVPQASTGYSPFELLFGRKPRGILDLARDQWEEEAGRPVKRKGIDLGTLRARLQDLARWARTNLEGAQERQRVTYDEKVRPREFREGQEVLVLLPSTEVKLLAKWQGPFKVCRRVTPVDYEVEMPGGTEGRKVYHVNLLKEWKDRVEEVYWAEDFGPSGTEAQEVEGKVVVGEELDEGKKAELRKIQEDFPEVFSARPGHTRLVQHRIQVKGAGVVRLPPRRWPKHLEEALNREVATMLELGVIEPSRSEWRSYPVMVPKVDGTVRVCIDYRKVNGVSSFDAYPMPRIPGLLEKLGRAKYLTTLDLTKGYWQIPLSPESKPLTAFATPMGLYQFRRMPFGLHGAAATFQRLVDLLLKEHREYAAAYIDDIIIFSESWEKHVQDIRKVIKTLREAGLTVNPKKCCMGRETTQYLGFMVGRGQVRPVSTKVEAIQGVPPPSNRKETQRFLGMVGYYRAFIPNFSQLAAPLTDAIRGRRSRKWEWTRECQTAFEELKGALCRAPVLRSPDFSRPFKVLTDASARGLGAVLAQDFEEGEHPIMYLSRKLSPPEQNYSTIERETLAVKWAVETLRYYLLGAPFTLVTDHAPLTWLSRMKDSNARLTRWYLALQPYKFEVQYKKGQTHVNADFLSRQGGHGTSASWTTAAPFLEGEVCQDVAKAEGIQEGMAAMVEPHRCRRGVFAVPRWQGRRGQDGRGDGRVTRGWHRSMTPGPQTRLRPLPRSQPRDPTWGKLDDGSVPIDEWPGVYERKPLAFFKELWEAEMRGAPMDTRRRGVTFGPGVSGVKKKEEKGDLESKGGGDKE